MVRSRGLGRGPFGWVHPSDAIAMGLLEDARAELVAEQLVDDGVREAAAGLAGGDEVVDKDQEAEGAFEHDRPVGRDATQVARGERST